MKMFRPKFTLTIVFASIALCLLTMSVCALNSPSVFAAGPQQFPYCTPYPYRGFGITVRPVQANPSETVTITGQCFTPNGTVTVYTSNLPPFTVTADERGNMTAIFAAPAIPGMYTVTAEDMDTALFASASYRVYGAAASPRITVNPTAVNPYTQANFSINGTNFTPDTTVTCSVTGGTTLTPSSTTTDAFGNFGMGANATFTIPGTYTITCVDGDTGNAGSAKIQVR
jgi:hypothetical protein